MKKEQLRYDGNWDELTNEYSYLQTNPFIRYGYRLHFALDQCHFSLFHIHNEFVNIWSHLIGFILVICMVFHSFYMKSYNANSIDYQPMSLWGSTLISNGRHSLSLIALLVKPEWMVSSSYFDGYLLEIPNTLLENQTEFIKDQISQMYYKSNLSSYTNNIPKWPIYLFLLSAFICLSFSAFYHLILCVSYQIQQRFKTLDYIGISVLIAGSYYPVVIYSFYCDTTISIVYLTTITISSTAILFLTLSEFGLSPAGQTVRTIAYMIIGLLGIIPFTHILLQYGSQSENYQYIGPGLIWMGLSYCIGAILYATKIPERIFPGVFDYIGSSHQIFHILIVIAVLIHYYTCSTLYNWLGNIQNVFCKP